MAINNIIGMAGVGCVLLAYYAIQTDRIRQGNPWYSIINGIGSLLILVSLYYDFNLPSVVIEFAWLTISIIGLVRALRKRAAAAGEPHS
ncbi:MAG: hypothetical protein PVJ40_00535 [Gammaproteobacteria bacterium]|jgi:hypothetical protein